MFGLSKGSRGTRCVVLLAGYGRFCSSLTLFPCHLSIVSLTRTVLKRLFLCKHSLLMKRSLNQNHSCPKFSHEQRLACGPTVVHAAEPDFLGFRKKNFREIMTQKQFIVAGGSVCDCLGRLKIFDGFLDLSRL